MLFAQQTPRLGKQPGQLRQFAAPPRGQQFHRPVHVAGIQPRLHFEEPSAADAATEVAQNCILLYRGFSIREPRQKRRC